MPSAGKPAQARSGMMDLLALAAIVILIASAALAAAVFLYQQFLKTESASKLDQLERAKAAFEPSLIQELARLDDRMNAAETVLGGHSAPSVLFRVLEQVTLQTVSFESLEFTATDAEPSVSMRGLAGSVNAIALQADLLNKSGIFKNPIFSNITREPGGVRFDLTAGVDSTSLNFVRLVNSAAASLAAPESDTGALQQAPAQQDQPQQTGGTQQRTQVPATQGGAAPFGAPPEGATQQTATD